MLGIVVNKGVFQVGESYSTLFVSMDTRPANTAQCGSVGREATYSTRKEVNVERVDTVFHAANREGRCAGIHPQLGHKPRPLSPRHASLFPKFHAGSVPRHRYWVPGRLVPLGIGVAELQTLSIVVVPWVDAEAELSPGARSLMKRKPIALSLRRVYFTNQTWKPNNSFHYY